MPVALVGVGFESLEDAFLKLDWYVRIVIPWFPEIDASIHLFAQDFIRAVPLEWFLPGQHLIAHHPKGENIDPVIDRFSSELLRGHVGRGSRVFLKFDRCFRAGLREIEVKESHITIA